MKINGDVAQKSDTCTILGGIVPNSLFSTMPNVTLAFPNSFPDFPMKKLTVLGLVLLFVSGLDAQNSSPGWGDVSWIWDQPDADKVAQSNEPRYVRRAFTLSAKPVQAELWITADNHYTVYLNGHTLGADGEWSTVEKYQVSKYLVQGKNVLAILAKNEGGPAGLIARLHVRTADKKNHLIGTGPQTRITQVKN